LNPSDSSRPAAPCPRRSAAFGTALGLLVCLGVSTAAAAESTPHTDSTAPGSVVDPAGDQYVDADGNFVLGSYPAVARAAAVADQYIVQVSDEAVLADVSAELAETGVRIVNTLAGEFVGLVAPLDASTANGLRSREGVIAVERDELINISGTQTSPPWNLDRIDQRRPPLDHRYSYRATGAGVTAYVIDSGIRPTHVDFKGRLPRGAYFDFGDGTGIHDCAGHGTHVAGTIGGTTWGVAKSVEIVPVKALDCTGSAPSWVIIEGINWVIQDHRQGVPAVVNMSLGGSASPTVDNAVMGLIRDGITVVVAAGNAAAPTCSYSPARVSAAITVAASTSTDDVAYFSNYGGCNDLFAPGVGIRSASYLSDTGSAVFDGTSMAAPHVTGAAALFLQGHPSATPAQVWAGIDADTTRGVISVCCGDPDKLLHVTSTPQAPSAPSAPQSLTAHPGNRSVTLRWAAPLSSGGSRISDYRVQRSANGGRTWSTVADGVSSARYATVKWLTNGRRYHFRVAATNHTGTGKWSRAASAIPATRPSSPRWLRGEPANRSVRLTWTAPATNGGAPVTDYRIQRSANGGRTWSTVADGVSSAPRTTVNWLTNGTRYSFRAAAKNRVGVGPWSKVVSAIPLTNPSAPRWVSAAPANHSVRLTWPLPSSNGGAAITDYAVQRSADGGRTWRTVADGVSSARRAVVDGLTNGRRYHFRVAAKNRAGLGRWSRAVSAIPVTTPSAPQSLSASAGNGVVRLTWSLPSSDGEAPITDYVVQRSDNAGATWATIADGVSTARRLPLGGLANGQRYDFRVAAKNRAGTGSWSTAVSAMPSADSAEDDGSIPLTGESGIGPVSRSFSTSAAIGDGPHGNSGSRSGDFDFYRVDLVEGDVLTAATSTSVDLRARIFVYDSTGRPLVYDDDDGVVRSDSRVEISAPVRGSYYVAIAGMWTSQVDPFDSGSGDGAGTEGPYDLTITATR
jgi:subtilisin family serine protease